MMRPSRFRSLLPAFLLAGLLLCPLPGAPVQPGSLHAQEEYVLEEDTWKKLDSYPADSPEGRLQTIRRLIAQGEPKRASRLAGAWIDQFPNHPLLVEALLLRGDALVSARDEYKALFDYERVIREFPGTEQFNTALEREFEIARLYAAGMRRKLWGMRIVPAQAEAEEIFIRIQERSPGSAIGERASMALGDYYFENSEMRRAAEAYSLFLINYPRSPLRERAMLRAIQASLASFKGPNFDATGLLEADRRIRQFRREYPASAERIGADALLVRIDESLALKMFLQGRWYLGQGLKTSAVTVFQRVVQEHPRTNAAQQAMEELVKLGHPVVAPRVGQDVEEGLITEPEPDPSASRIRIERPGQPAPIQEEQKNLPDAGPQIPGAAPPDFQR